MKPVKIAVKRILHPAKGALIIISVVSFAALIFVFANKKTEGMPTYLIYFMSAYSLAVLCIAAPAGIKKVTHTVKNSKFAKRILTSKAVGKYISDLSFRGNISIYQGMTVNFLNTAFRIFAGIRYASVWFISMAAYYFVLGIIRVYLIICCKRRNIKNEVVCYRNTAWCLLLLNIPMGGMILLMINTNSGFSYPGYIIYLSALYTFYAFIVSVKNIVKFRRVGSPALSAAKVLNFIAAMMSVLGLQTAMISRFSVNGEGYRKTMNSITGGTVYAVVFAIAVYMLIHTKKLQRR